MATKNYNSGRVPTRVSVQPPSLWLAKL